MPKDRGDIRGRMREAALELFHEKGYDVTTAAAIAARAGVTERTFFRHFPDKREALFNEVELGGRLETAIAAAPPELSPVATVLWSFQQLASLFEENLKLAETSHAVIAKTPALQERQLAKVALMTRIIAKALAHRGIETGLAGLAAATSMAVTSHGLQTWVQDPSSPLVDHFASALHALHRTLRD